MGKVDNIRKIIRSLIAENMQEVHPEKIEFPELDGWKAIKHDPKYRVDNEGIKYAIIDQHNDWIASYELPDGILYKNIGGRGQAAHWVKVTSDTFPNVQQATRWLYLQVAQGTFKRTLNEQIIEKVAGDLWAKRISEPGTFDGRTSYWEIYDGKHNGQYVGKVIARFWSNGWLYPSGDTSKIIESHIFEYDFEDESESIKQVLRWMYLQMQQQQQQKQSKKTKIVSEGGIKETPGYEKYDHFTFPDINNYQAIVFTRKYPINRESRIIGSQFIDVYDSNNNEVGHINAQGDVYWILPNKTVSINAELKVSHDENGVRNAAQFIFLKRAQYEKRVVNESEGLKTIQRGKKFFLPELGYYDMTARKPICFSYCLSKHTNQR